VHPFPALVQTLKCGCSIVLSEDLCWSGCVTAENDKQLEFILR